MLFNCKWVRYAKKIWESRFRFTLSFYIVGLFKIVFLNCPACLLQIVEDIRLTGFGLESITNVNGHTLYLAKK